MDNKAKEHLLPPQLQRHYRRLGLWNRIEYVHDYADADLDRIGVVLSDHLEGWVKTFDTRGNEYWIKVVSSPLD